MARGVNKVILIGNLGADPVTRYTTAGMAITNVSLATTEQRTDKQSGDKQDHTEWHRVVLFGKLGEIANEYLKKGQQVYIEGSIRSSKYTDKAGVEKYSTEIIANNMQMLGGGGGGAGGESGGGYRERPAGAGQSRGGDDRQSNQSRPAAPSAPADNGFADDEIPF
ncbi:MAG: single-stranded DNA-binding protein [Rhodanobacter sp.]